MSREQKITTRYNVFIAGSKYHREGSLKVCSEVRYLPAEAVVVAMSFHGYQGEVNPQVRHEIPGAEEGGQMVQLTQVQLAQIVSSVVSQALTHHMQQEASNPHH